METVKIYNFNFVFAMFKSYYVVWKLQSYVTSEKEKIEFKSYYVVWKLSIYAIFFFISIMFKSYYVVWKRLQSNSFLITYMRLNRTM